MLNTKALLHTATALSIAMAATGAHAQDAPADHDTGAGEAATSAEIVVTAQRREQRLVDVPISVTALSSEMLNQRQIEDVGDLATAVPSLTFTPSINEQNNNLRMRGVGTVLFNQGLESSISYVVDGVVMARQGQGIQDLIDIERIEVLRGPQGTLFGKNATAGVISIVTQRPNDEFGFVGDTTIAEGNEYRARASVTGPLGERLAGRLTGFYNEVGGHIDNVATGADYNGGKSYGGRVQFEWDATDSLNLLLIGDYRKSEQDCCQWQAVRTDNPVYRAELSPVVPGRENRQVNTNAPTFNDTEQVGVSLQAEIDTAIGTVTSITAYREWQFAANNDADSLFTPVPIFGGPNTIGSFDLNQGETDIRQFSQELRLASSGGGPLQYVLGLYYFNLDLDRVLTRRIGFCFPAPLTPANAGLLPGQDCRSPTFQSRQGLANTRNENFAAFGQVDWQLLDALTLIAGFRLQRDEVSYEGSRAAAPAPGFASDGVLGATFIGGAAANAGSGSAADTDLSGRLGVQYAFDRNVQSYFTYTRGYKGQGYDIEPTTNFANQSPVRPETVDAYELGFKGSFAGGTFGLNAAAFHQEYSDLQVQASVDTGGLRAAVPTNAGSSVSKGVELEFFARPSRELTFTAGLTVLDSSVDVDGLNCLPGAPVTIVAAGSAAPENTCFRLTGEATGANRQNVRDGRLPNAPSQRLTVTGRYDDDVESLGVRLFAQASLVMQSDVSFSLEQDPLLVEDGYPLVDASVGVGSIDRRYTLTLFVKNLFDRNYAGTLFRDALWPSSATAANINGFFGKDSERYFGANVRVSFP